MASRRARNRSLNGVITHLRSRVGRVEKRPAASKLKSNVVSSKNIGYKAVRKESIAKEAVTPEEVSFGINEVSDTLPTENLKEGYTVTDPVTGGQQVYSANDDTWTPVSDPVAIFDAAAAAATAAAAAAAATAAQTTADGKNKIYRQPTIPTGGTYAVGDLWFDTANDNRMSRYAAAASHTVSNKALTSNVATLTTATEHGMSAGYTVTVSGVDATFNGTFTVLDAPSVTTFTYALVSANVSSTASSGTAASHVGWYVARFSTNALGVIDASVVNVSNLNAGNISTGYLAAARIATGSLDASVITAGTITATQINAGYVYAGSIAANQITAGTITATVSLSAATITAGTMKIGNNVDGGTDDGIYMNDDNYWYKTAGTFKAGSSSQYLLFDGTDLTVTGEINATSGTFTGSITSSTVTGGTIQTATSGARIVMSSVTPGNIAFYDAASTATGLVSVTTYALYLYGPGSATGDGAKMQLYSDQHTTGSLAGLAAIQAGGTGDITLTTATNAFRIDGSTTKVHLTSASPFDEYGLRNIRGRLTAEFDPGTNTSGTDGDIVVVYS